MWAQLENVIQRCESRFGNRDGTARTFSWMGQDIPCVVSTLRHENQVAVGGFEFTDALTLTVRGDAMPEEVTADMDTITVDSDTITADNDFRVPRVGDKITFESQDYRVMAVAKNGRTSSTRASFWRFTLADPH